MVTNKIVVRFLGMQPYAEIWQAMQKFTELRDDATIDEMWVLEHPAIYTLGQNGKEEHILNPGLIPVLKVDRGGQVTYHGPGQLIIYTLLDLKRKKFNTRQLVCTLENAIIKFLKEFSLHAHTEVNAPGVYVSQKKIGSLGLRIKKGCSFHGLALNLAMDLEPFSRINPCGYPNLKMTQLSEFHPVDFQLITFKLINYLIENLGYTTRIDQSEKWHGKKCN